MPCSAAWTWTWCVDNKYYVVVHTCSIEEIQVQKCKWKEVGWGSGRERGRKFYVNFPAKFPRSFDLLREVGELRFSIQMYVISCWWNRDFRMEEHNSSSTVYAQKMHIPVLYYTGYTGCTVLDLQVIFYLCKLKGVHTEEHVYRVFPPKLLSAINVGLCWE